MTKVSLKTTSIAGNFLKVALYKSMNGGPKIHVSSSNLTSLSDTQKKKKKRFPSAQLVSCVGFPQPRGSRGKASRENFPHPRLWTTAVTVGRGLLCSVMRLEFLFTFLFFRSLFDIQFARQTDLIIPAIKRRRTLKDSRISSLKPIPLFPRKWTNHDSISFFMKKSPDGSI